MKQYKWTLRKGSKKERCPNCGHKRFVPYVLTADPQVLAGALYGRCDRENSCGYHRYPDFKKDDEFKYIPPMPKAEERKEPILLGQEWANEHNFYANNTLYKAFNSFFDDGILTRAMNDYRCSTGGNGECIYPQFDGENVRTAKAIKYDKRGHRVKDESGEVLPVYWLHKSPFVAKEVEGKELRQCFFGQHLLCGNPENEVCVVESEKSAVLLHANSIQEGKDDITWIACGGSQMLKGSIDLSVLYGRKVTLYPDDGQYFNWLNVSADKGWDIVDVEELVEAALLPKGSDIWDVVEFFSGGSLRKEASNE